VLWADNEGCDDGNQDLEVCAYGLERCTVCDPTCQEVAGATAYCGDGEVFGDVEVCDDGNTIDGDGCSGDCATACETPDPESFTSGQYGGSTYAISRAQVSWQEAQAQCRSFCGHLIAVNDRAEYGFYQGLMSRADAGGVWIGLTPTDQNRQHTWSNGDPLTFTYYCDYPNGNGCANPPHPPVPGQCTTSSQYWYPEPCTNRRQFLCELP
jgi:cysteine-rich repeat protein